jgi:hypothetical protein
LVRQSRAMSPVFVAFLAAVLLPPFVVAINFVAAAVFGPHLERTETLAYSTVLAGPFLVFASAYWGYRYAQDRNDPTDASSQQLKTATRLFIAILAINFVGLAVSIVGSK